MKGAQIIHLVVFGLAVQCLASYAHNTTQNGTGCSADVSLQLPLVALSGVRVEVDIAVPEVVNNSILPTNVSFLLTQHGTVVGNGTLPSGKTSSVKVKISGSGHKSLELWIDGACDGNMSKELFVIPPELSILPPILTIALAVSMKQVLLALAAGIYLGCFFIYEYNPLTAFLRMYNKYITDAVGNHDNAAILVATILLGGLIAVVQRSGGAHGLASTLRKLAKTRRSSLIVACVMCFLIFFDDYSCILISGNTLRPVMSSAGVSKNKFGSVIHSIGPAIPSMVPVSSWIGFEVGTVRQTFAKGEVEPFIFTVKSIAYRFFPLLMAIFPLLTAVFGVEFGPMLTMERKAYSAHVSRTDPPNAYGVETTSSTLGDNEEVGANVQQLDTDAVRRDAQDVSAGGLDPKRGIPQRGINAAIPFGLVAVLSFVGMVLNGRAALLGMDPENRPAETFINFFGQCDAIAALMWATAVGTWVAFIMYLVQRLLSVKEFMEAWVLGVKEIMDPTLILILAWALGQIVKDLHASEWVSTAIGGSFKVELIPMMAAILACLMSYATGSAFGTMAILFPLVVPIVATHTGRPNGDLTLQAAGAIFGGAVFGNVVAPIADNTILTTLATPIELTTHLKTQTPYVLLVVLTSTVVGHLMVGFGFYPNYAALIISVGVMAIVLLLFGRSPIDDPMTPPLMYRLGYAVARRIRRQEPEGYQGALVTPDRDLSTDEKSPLYT